MAFGQQSGPPAPGNKVRELLELLQDAGHSDFRDARGPMGFTQRQAGGKFSRDEVDAFIEQLQEEAEGASEPPSTSAAKPAVKPATRSIPKQAAKRPAAKTLKDISSEVLAAELQSRGWIVAEP